MQVLKWLSFGSFCTGCLFIFAGANMDNTTALVVGLFFAGFGAIGARVTRSVE